MIYLQFPHLERKKNQTFIYIKKYSSPFDFCPFQYCGAGAAHYRAYGLGKPQKRYFLGAPPLPPLRAKWHHLFSVFFRASKKVIFS